MRIIVAAVMTLPPFSPGIAWDWLQIVVGLRRLGHDVCFVEEVRPDWSVDENGRRVPYAQSVNRRRFEQLMERFDLLDRACQLFDRGASTTGLSYQDLCEVASGTDLLLNVSGHLKCRPVLEEATIRAYLDQDPVYTQLWASEYGKALGLQDHEVFFTVGLNIGTARSPIPDCGVRWHPMLPPVVPDLWTYTCTPEAGRFTTVASLTGYAELEYRGRNLGSKHHEFARFVDLPRRSEQSLEVALKAFRPDDELIHRMRASGWIVTSAAEIDGLSSYQRYIARSRAEIGIAQQAYVATRSGWFSDRSAHYLAMGKPALAQATGFEDHLPTGKGLLTFADVDEAAAAIEAVNADYEGHSRAARGLAEAYLDYRVVLPEVLETCVTTGRARARVTSGAVR